MIKPTIGRQVWFWKSGANIQNDQPEAATVIYVHGDRKVNLLVIDHYGDTRALLNIPLLQDGDEPPTGPYCEWMPFQKGQAAKT